MIGYDTLKDTGNKVIHPIFTDFLVFFFGSAGSMLDDMSSLSSDLG